MSDFVQKNPCEVCTHVTSNSYSEYPKSNQVHFICPSCNKERKARQRAEFHEFAASKECAVFIRELAKRQKSQAREALDK